MRKSKKLTLTLMLLSGATLAATQPVRVVVDSTDDFFAGRSLGVAIEEPGSLSAGSLTNQLADLKNKTIWSIAQNPLTKNLIIGTGPEGEVFKVKPQKKFFTNGRPIAQKITAFTESDVYAVTAGLKGEMFIASSPKGKVFRIDASGKIEPYFNPNEQYIWSMAVNPKGELFVATGTSGKIYRVTAKNTGSLYYDSDEPSIKVLSFDKSGALLAGSAGNGYLYRITAVNEAVVLLDSEKEEISALAVQKDGTIFASAVGKRTVAVKKSEPAPLEITKATTNPISAAFSSEMNPTLDFSNGKSSSTIRSSSKNDGGLLYRIASDLYPQVVWKSSEPIFSLAMASKALWIGTGSDGNLYQYTSGEKIQRVAKLSAADVTALIQPADGNPLLAATSNTGLLFEVLEDTAKKCTYESKVIDSGLFSKWGKLRVYGEGDWTIRTRSGNTADPDKSWYDWVGVNDQFVKSPAARYFQFELAFTKATIKRVEFTYLPQNQAPTLNNIKILEPGYGYDLLAQPPPPPQAQTVEQLLKSNTSAYNEQARFQPMYRLGLRTIVWQAQDPNKNPLVYKLEIRSEKERVWATLEKNLEHSIYSWDTLAWPDGVYYTQVTASDLPENDSAYALEVTALSEAWRIDNTAPLIKLTRKDSRQAEITIMDATSPLRLVEVSYNGKNYKSIQPQDGILDSLEENFIVLNPSKATLYIKTEDENGNSSGLRIIP